MKFARIVFLVAGLFGLIVVTPQYFFESRTGHDFPPPITHPEFYYGFIGVTVAWQILFLILSRDPERYRPIMIPAVLEKAGWVIAVAVLYLQQRIPTVMVPLAGIDLVFGILFVFAYLKTPSLSR